MAVDDVVIMTFNIIAVAPCGRGGRESRTMAQALTLVSIIMPHRTLHSISISVLHGDEVVTSEKNIYVHLDAM